MTDNQNIIDEMMLALDANIKYLQKEGSSSIRLTNGQLTSVVGELHIYEFVMDFLQDIDPDSEIEIRIKNESVSGKVTGINENIIEVQLEKNIGSTISEAMMIISSYYLLQLLYNKLQKIKNGEIKITDLANKTFNPDTSKSMIDNDYIIPSVGESLNEFQERALRLVMGSEVSYIWGPPGTGKTHLIAKMLEGMLSLNYSTLLLSHTNKATDEALNKTVQYLLQTKQLSDLESGNIIRIGKVNADSKLYETENDLKSIDYVDPGKALEIKGNPIRKEIGDLNAKIDKINKECEYSEKIVELFNNLENCDKNIEKISRELVYNKNKLISSKELVTGYKHKLADINQRIANYQNSNSIMRFFSGTNLSQLTSEKTKLLENIEDLKQKNEATIYQIETIEGRLRIFTEEAEKLRNDLRGNSREENEVKVHTNRKIIKDLDSQKSELENQLNNLISLVVKNAKIIATTLTKSYSSSEILSREYDCVIIDEASMAPLPAVWHACGLSKTKTVIVGDFLQLPPIAKHKVLDNRNLSDEQKQAEQDLVDKWLKRDVFKASGVEENLRNKTLVNCLQQLRRQYRMHPDISNLVNHLVYSKIGKDYELISDIKATSDKGSVLLSKTPLPDFHIGVFDTSEVGTIAVKTDTGSYYNLYNALLAVDIAKQAIKSGYKTIGIISPFRAQVNLIQKILKDENTDDKVVVDTVHKFQGGEKQIIIFDITTTNQTKLTDDSQDGGDDEKLINVAFSRTQEKCIVIVDSKSLLVKHSLSSKLRMFVEYSRLNNYPFVNAKEILPKYVVTDKTEKWLSKIVQAKELEKVDSQSKLFDETDFYNVFVNDLLKAKNEVVIDSPYITMNRVNFFLPIFRHLISKGVNIFLLTRMTKEHSSLMKQQAESGIKELSKLGVVVLPFVGFIHRKLAIIDRNILWEGSLNILSQKDSHEVMRRFEGESTCNQMFKFLKLDKNIGKIGTNNLRSCEFCKETGAYYWTDKSRFGSYWTYCLLRMHKPGVVPKTDMETKEQKEKLTSLRKMVKKYTPAGEPICPNPNHESQPMIKRKSRFGGYLWGCKFYPRCKITEKYIDK